MRVSGVVLLGGSSDLGAIVRAGSRARLSSVSDEDKIYCSR